MALSIKDGTGTTKSLRTSAIGSDLMHHHVPIFGAGAAHHAGSYSASAGGGVFTGSVITPTSGRRIAVDGFYALILSQFSGGVLAAGDIIRLAIYNSATQDSNILWQDEIPQDVSKNVQFAQPRVLSVSTPLSVYLQAWSSAGAIRSVAWTTLGLTIFYHEVTDAS